jgi:hypothetical protein
MLGQYQNGNCIVTLYKDGTKERSWDGVASPDYPESIDLKITDYCDAGCPFCHEKSTKNGIHAGLFRLLQIIHGLPAGTEIAIGGGNPLDYPHLYALLRAIRGAGLVANITARDRHFIKHSDAVCALSDASLVHGVGISVDSVDVFGFMSQSCRLPAHVVFHVIAGISSAHSVLKSAAGQRILVLGYKKYGFGEKYFSPKVQSSLNEWRYWIGSIMRRCESVSFDNLALEQLGVKERVTPKAWAESFMGDDGKFTMYVDGVRNEYASSSTSPRLPMGNMSAADAFKVLNQKPSPSSTAQTPRP